MHKVVLWIQTVLVPLLGAPGMFLVAFLDSSFLSFPRQVLTVGLLFQFISDYRPES